MTTPNYPQRHTEAECAKLEKRLRKVYEEAGKEIDEKTADFWNRHRTKAMLHWQEVQDGKLSLEDYQAWLRGQVFQGEQWKEKKNQIANVLYDTNTKAQRMINGELSNIFQFNANYMAYEMEHGEGIDLGFNVLDSASVTRILRDDPHILPSKKLVKGKDVRWNFKNIKNELVKGIIQGETIDQLTTRLTKQVPNRNWKQMRTHARTAYGNAMNGARNERIKELNLRGVRTDKQWLATLDERTRWMHRDLDMQTVPEDEPFEIGEYTIMYPHDPNAEPAMVYNCRCRLHYSIAKYPDEWERRDNIDGSIIGDMTYNEWAEAKGIENKRPQGMKPVSRVR